MAGNAHLIGSQTSASASGTGLTVKFKEAGLEYGSVETIRVTAHLDGPTSARTATSSAR